MLELYENIRSLRFFHCMTQSELAEKTGYRDKGMISRIERGLVDLPISKIELFAKALGTDPIKLMGNSWDQVEHITGRLSASEQSLLDNFRQLNDDGQRKAAEYVEDLAGNDKYTAGRGSADRPSASPGETA